MTSPNNNPQPHNNIEQPHTPSIDPSTPIGGSDPNKRRPIAPAPSTSTRDERPRVKKAGTDHKPWWKRWWVITLAALLAIALASGAAVAAFPGQILGGAIRLVSNAPSPVIQDMIDGTMPTTSTIRDKDGTPLTYFYDQYRVTVESSDISPNMKDAIVAIEDRRFYEHEGVDWFGIMRAAVTNTLEGEIEQGASTLTQQYVKNYTWLIDADTEEERAQAITQTVDRKLSEITTAETLTARTDKDTILTNYLNLVTFGNGTYGVEAASRTYFGVSANELTPAQSALLAGLVQAPSAFDPYINPDAALERRNTVLNAMARYGTITETQAAQFSAGPLGILDAPARLPQGCAGAGNNGFYCDRVVSELNSQGIDLDALKSGGYDITTALDPETQAATLTSLQANADPHTVGAAETLVFIEPNDNRYIRSLGTSRIYGFDDSLHHTTLPLADSLVGAGAGSVFKIFTAAVALEEGVGLNSRLRVPATYVASGLGEGGSANCPPGKYCVANVGAYPEVMTLTDTLAQSPNTPFVALAERVGNDRIVNMAVALGLRSYERAAEGETSIADRMRSSGSFTLGPTRVNTVELSNVAATLASQGRWCEPTALVSATGPEGDIALASRPCEDVLDPGVAANLANGLAQDVITGTAATAAANAGWSGPMAGKTGTTDDHSSASFLGFTSGLAGAVYAFNDGPESMSLCTGPLRQCNNGNLFGGNEPAKTWFDAAMPVLGKYGGPALPSATASAGVGRSAQTVAEIALGRPLDSARALLINSGFTIGDIEFEYSDDVPENVIISAELDGIALSGDPVNLKVSRGKEPEPTPTTTARSTERTDPRAPSREPSREPSPRPQRNTTTMSPPSGNSGMIGAASLEPVTAGDVPVAASAAGEDD